MTIAALNKELSGVIREHSVYGAEAIINALVSGAKSNQYLDRAAIHKLVDDAFNREEVSRYANSKYRGSDRGQEKND